MVKDRRYFLRKMPPNLALFWRKIAKNLALSSRKWHKKNLNGENGGERKINPSANPAKTFYWLEEIKYNINHRLEHVPSFLKMYNITMF